MKQQKTVTITVPIDVARALYSILEVIQYSPFEIKFKPAMRKKLYELYDNLAFFITTGGE